MTAVKSIQLPVDVVAALFEFAGRGRLDRAEWQFLEKWEATVRQGIAQASAPKPEADVTVDPPFDPNTEDAERKRQRRRDRRKAEATALAVKNATAGEDEGASDEGDAGEETPTA